jgi:hypothetical protein
VAGSRSEQGDFPGAGESLTLFADFGFSAFRDGLGTAISSVRMIRRAWAWLHFFLFGLNQIAFEFNDPEMERRFWESVERERRKQRALRELRSTTWHGVALHSFFSLW